MISRHLTGTLSADFDSLNNAQLVEQACLTAAVDANATVLNVTTHKFEPQGVTSLILLGESHLAIHTWPELKRAMVDIATCGDHTDPVAGWRSLLKELAAEVVEMDMRVRSVA